jgi:hypothetical protein
MFRAILRSSSGGQNCISTASGIITLYERPCIAPVESGLQLVIKTSLYYDARSEKHQIMKMHVLAQTQHSPSPLKRQNPQCCLEK